MESKYAAFISYKREDEEWAVWLHKKLEGYHIPSVIIKDNPDIIKGLRPIFLDRDELSSGVLSEEIHTALSSSKYLIVICSPNVKESYWVNREVEVFIEQRGSENVIPFIIDGEPHAEDSSRECFPESLSSLNQNREILGININEMGRDAAVVKVISRMLGLSFDSLWRRFERQKKRRLGIFLSLSILLIAISILIIISFNIKNNRINRMRSRVIAERIISLVNDGNAKMGQRVALELLPKDYSHRRRNIVPEVEAAMRYASWHQSVVLGPQFASIDQIQYSKDGSKLYSVSGNTLYEWDTNIGMLIDTTVFVGADAGLIIAPTPNEGEILVAYNQHNSHCGFIQLWDVGRKTKVRTIFKRDAYVFARKGQSSDETGNKFVFETLENVYVLDCEDNYQYRELYKGRNSQSSISPTGQSVAIDENKTRGLTLIPDINKSDSLVSIFPEGVSDVMSIDFSKDGTSILVALADNAIRVWDGEKSHSFNSLSGKDIREARFCYDPNLVVFRTEDGLMYLFDISNDRIIQEIYGVSKIKAFALSPDKKSIAYGSSDGYIHFISTDVRQESYPNHEIYKIEALAYANDICSEMAAAVYYGGRRVKCIDINGKENNLRLRHDVSELVFSEDDENLAIGYENGIIDIYNPLTGTLIDSLRNIEGEIERMFLSKDRIFFKRNGDMTIYESNLKDKKVLPAVAINENFLRSPYINEIYCCDDNILYITTSSDIIKCNINIRPRKSRIYQHEGGSINNVAYNKKRKWIAVAKRTNTIDIYQQNSMRLLFRIKSINPSCVAFREDGLYLAAIDEEGLKVWYLDNKGGVEVFHIKLELEDSLISSMSDCRKIAFSSDGNGLLLFDVMSDSFHVIEFPKLEDLQKTLANTWFNYPLTSEEKKMYLFYE